MHVLLIENGPAASIPQAGVGESGDNSEDDPRSENSQKRQKNSSTVSTSRSADQAMADEQPRRTQ
jgi:protein required for attachment to host cells